MANTPTLASPLDPLLAARSISHRHLSGQPTTTLVVHPPCQLHEEGPVDVALLEVGSWQASRIREARSALSPQTLVVIGPPPRGVSAREQAFQQALLLGRHGCLCTPRFTLNAVTPSGRPTKLLRPTHQRGRGIALIVQDVALARLHAEVLSRWELPLCLIVATAAQPADYWRGWLEAVARSRQVTAVLLALSSSPDSRWLAGTVLPGSVPVALHLLGDRRATGTQHVVGHPDRPPDVSDVARALGWTVAHSLECAAEVVRLLIQQPRPQRGPVVALGETELHRRTVIQSLHRSGLRAKQHDHGPMHTDDISVVVSAGSVRLGPLCGRPHLTLTPSSELLDVQTALAATDATLDALATLLRSTGQAGVPTALSDESKQAASMAQQLLKGYPAALHELHVKALLAPFGVMAPAEQLTTSASAAADVARRLRAPMTLKAIGPTIVARSQWGGVKLDVSSVSSARQAFRDIVQATQDSAPAARLDGVLVSQMVKAPVTMDCAIYVLGPLQLLQLQLRCGAAYLGRRQSLRCPLSERDATALSDLLFGEASRALAPWHPPRKSERRALATFLAHLSGAGAALATDLRWIRLDTVSLPNNGRPALVLDAAAARQGDHSPAPPS